MFPSGFDLLGCCRAFVCTVVLSDLTVQSLLPPCMVKAKVTGLLLGFFLAVDVSTVGIGEAPVLVRTSEKLLCVIRNSGNFNGLQLTVSFRLLFAKMTIL